MGTSTAPNLITPGVIAKELSQPIHRVLRVLATRSHIRPSARAGRCACTTAEPSALVARN